MQVPYCFVDNYSHVVMDIGIITCPDNWTSEQVKSFLDECFPQYVAMKARYAFKMLIDDEE